MNVNSTTGLAIKGGIVGLLLIEIHQLLPCVDFKM